MPKPKLPPGKAKTELLQILVTKEEKEKLKQLAKESNCKTISKYIRLCIEFEQNHDFQIIATPKKK